MTVRTLVSIPVIFDTAKTVPEGNILVVGQKSAQRRKEKEKIKYLGIMWTAGG